MTSPSAVGPGPAGEAPPAATAVPLLRDGAGVRIGLVDSGVDASHPWLATCTLRHLAVQRRGEAWSVAPGPAGDASGHGTACAGLLHRLVPAAEIVSVRALDAAGRGSRDALLAALRACVRERLEVVNLSLGIDVPRGVALRPGDHRALLELYELADAAYTARVVIVAAGPNVAAFRTYPGRFKSLIGVGRASFVHPDALRSEVTEDHEILAPGSEVLAPALGGGERRWTGTSFACPHVVAQVARIRAARPDLGVEAVRGALHALAQRAPHDERFAP